MDKMLRAVNFDDEGEERREGRREGRRVEDKVKIETAVANLGLTGKA